MDEFGLEGVVPAIDLGHVTLSVRNIEDFINMHIDKLEEKVEEENGMYFRSRTPT
jgi:hypothetical protein